LENRLLDQWVPPEEFAAGWIVSSALLGEKGNTVIGGHHNDYGEVFGKLVDVNIGDAILVFTDSAVFHYTVANRMILQELDVPIEQRIENAQWLGRSTDERLTLVTCWPKTGNSHRLILVARPD
jgi:sortase A